MITQQQALEATGCAYACARAANLRGPIYEYLTQVRQYIEQGAGAAPGADVVMVPRKTAISAREHAPYLGETWRALNAAISAVQHPQQEQPK